MPLQHHLPCHQQELFDKPSILIHLNHRTYRLIRRAI